MSDNPFLLPETPLRVTATQARDTAHIFKGLAEHMENIGARGEATRAERHSAWWMAYAAALSQIPPEAAK
ncbi:MAG TPA: hypothetical protein VN681_13245 [Stellaceae bacterium]|nr:hypothetical protein [Stellaceae bacterium]